MSLTTTATPSESHEEIAIAAYFIWLARMEDGAFPVSDVATKEQDWLEAEKELQSA